jgi:hypothetical protein
MTDDVALTQGDRLSPAVQVTHGSMELQPRDVQHQLAVPPLRPPGVPDRRWPHPGLALADRLRRGVAWHNNHHAFPTSARHGLGRGDRSRAA